MTDLELLTAELERQNHELEACFEQMRSLDPDMVIAVSPEWMTELTTAPAPAEAPVFWALRG